MSGAAAVRRYFADEPAMCMAAAQLAPVCQAPLCIYLSGPLGAGKTSFARAILRAKGYRGRVKSPSYVLLETYQLADTGVLHLDLYRIADPEELAYLGLTELYSDHLCLIEWSEKGDGMLPAADLVIRFEDPGEGRWLEFEAQTGLGQNAIDQLVGDSNTR